MHKQDIAEIVRRITKASKINAQRVANAIEEEYEKILLRNDEINFRFGDLKIIQTKSRYGWNFHTREPMSIPPKNIVKFEMRPRFKKMLNPK